MKDIKNCSNVKKAAKKFESSIHGTTYTKPKSSLCQNNVNFNLPSPATVQRLPNTLVKPKGPKKKRPATKVIRSPKTSIPKSSFGLSLAEIDKENQTANITETERSSSLAFTSNEVVADSMIEKCTNELVSHFEFVDMINKFTFDFYSILSSRNLNESVLFSPLSMYFMMHLFYSCSANDAKLELFEILNLNDSSHEKKDLHAIISKLVAENKFKTVVHSKENFLLDRFSEILSKDYYAILNGLSSYEANEIIDDNLFMTLTNNFEIMSQMKASNVSLYSENPKNLKIKICEIPLESDLILNVLIADNKNVLNDIKLNDREFKELTSEIKENDILLTLPLDTNITCEMNILNVIEDFGGKSLTDVKQDVPNYGLFISNATSISSLCITNQMVQIKTEINFALKKDKVLSSVVHPLKKEINHIDESKHPFIFLIRDRRTNVILIMGKIM